MKKCNNFVGGVAKGIWWEYTFSGSQGIGAPKQGYRGAKTWLTKEENEIPLQGAGI